MDSLQQKNSDVATYRSESGFLPVVPQSTNNNACKYYLGFILDTKSDQNLNYIFCHSDQDAFYKPSEIIWKETKYQSIINIMGGFHILLVTQKVLYEKYNIMGLKNLGVRFAVRAGGNYPLSKAR